MYLCLSQVGSSIETAERIKLAFARAASFHLSYTVLKGNLGKFKNKKLKTKEKDTHNCRFGVVRRLHVFFSPRNVIAKNRTETGRN